MSARTGAGAATRAGLYVYGVTEADAVPPSGVTGVADEVEALREGALAALVSRVDLAEFGEEPVRARLDDPLWVAEKARAHDALLASALRSGPVVPFRFLTVYGDERELRAFLVERAQELTRVLDDLRGKVEVGVKVFVSRAELARAVATDDPAPTEPDASAGRSYLLQRRNEQAAREEASRVATELANEIHARLLAAADAGVANTPQPRELSTREDDMLLNGAYLVDEHDARFADELAALRERHGTFGLTFEETGPWPAYNFVPRELAE